MNQHSDPNPTGTHLKTGAGIEVELLNYGAGLKSIKVPIGNRMVEVLLNYPDNRDYLTDQVYLGSTLGRYAGRINTGRVNLNGETLQLDQNEKNTGHCLHGGSAGFSRQFWSVIEQNKSSVSYQYVSADGEQGFPGCLTTGVDYRLKGPMTLEIELTATTDKQTIINLSNHAYFNLNGRDSSVSNHHLWVDSDHFTPLGDRNLPSGRVCEVGDSVFDFRHSTQLANRLNQREPQLQIAGGYDHYLLLNNRKREPTLAAILHSPETGVTMNMFTNQPGVQLYTGNWLGEPFSPNAGLCLEFQDIPDEPNLKGFCRTLLQPGEIYSRKIIFEFEP
jgi:aldose 1-epimerase